MDLAERDSGDAKDSKLPEAASRRAADRPCPSTLAAAYPSRTLTACPAPGSTDSPRGRSSPTSA
ncbi:hypothetical protein GCM10009788_14600 [Nocardioides humi]|uniref:Uncharacterized protein n=1 Tax=Nocardioides humi TaxID=449461 RepID=A0ABN2A6J9_9ACTN